MACWETSIVRSVTPGFHTLVSALRELSFGLTIRVIDDIAIAINENLGPKRPFVDFEFESRHTTSYEEYCYSKQEYDVSGTPPPGFTNHPRGVHDRRCRYCRTAR